MDGWREGGSGHGQPERPAPPLPMLRLPQSVSTQHAMGRSAITRLSVTCTRAPNSASLPQPPQPTPSHVHTTRRHSCSETDTTPCHVNPPSASSILPSRPFMSALLLLAGQQGPVGTTRILRLTDRGHRKGRGKRKMVQNAREREGRRRERRRKRGR
eukprot:2827087-Rhodomonas_salina.1